MGLGLRVPPATVMGWAGLGWPDLPPLVKPYTHRSLSSKYQQGRLSRKLHSRTAQKALFLLPWPTIRRSYSLKVYFSFPVLLFFFSQLFRIFIWSLSRENQTENLIFFWAIRRVNRPLHRVQNLGDNEG